MKIKILFPGAFLILALAFSACSDKKENKNDLGGGDYYCSQSVTACEGTFNACCNAVQCYYEYNGKKYNCDGTNCGEAAQQLTNDMCGDFLASADHSVQATKEEIMQHLMLVRQELECQKCP